MPIRRDKLGLGMIKDGLEYLMINGKMFTTGYRLESVKQFHRRNAKVVTMTKNCYNERAYDKTKIFVSYNTAVVALSRKYNACNDKFISGTVAISPYAFYSPTTRKQFMRFLNENGVKRSYYELKNVVENNKVWTPKPKWTIYRRQIEFPSYWEFDKFDLRFW